MIPLDTKDGTRVWRFDEAFAPRDGVITGTLFGKIQHLGDGMFQVVMKVPRRETASGFPIHDFCGKTPNVYLTEAEATEACAAWLLKEGERLNAMLHENEKKLWVARQRIHELKSGAKERDPR